MKYILGISAFYHDSAVALIGNGEIICAIQEERFSRIKHDAAFPSKSIHYILTKYKLSFSNIDKVVFYDKPFLKFERIVETYIEQAPKGFKTFIKSMPIWMREKLFLKKFLTSKIKEFYEEFNTDNLLFSEHHFSHAASAFYPSPFEEAVVLTLDGVGEWATTSVAIGKNNSLTIKKEINFPHSLGLLYSAFTAYTGFKVNSGEYKLMGLAPYGNPKYKKIILDNLIDIKLDGSFRLNQKYFNYLSGLTMTNKKFENLFKHKSRKSESEMITQFHMDIAASIQVVLDDILLGMTKSLYNEYQVPNLCLAGGVALNCVSNGKIKRSKSFSNIWIQPAAGDAGGAIGAALAVWYHEFKNNRNIEKHDSMKGSLLGPWYSNSEVETELIELNAVYEKMGDDELINLVANELSNGCAVGWFQGKMEFGPRALGSRSILADPRSKDTQKNLNLKVKFRENFRPFAPSILREKLDEWFNLQDDSPYMLLVDNIKDTRKIEETISEKKLTGLDRLKVSRSQVPAVTHVDYSSRIQTVHKRLNPKFHNLISKFYEITECPILVNTSFNIRGEPIVCSPQDAFRCFAGTDIDLLVIENYVLYKKSQKNETLLDYRHLYGND